MKNNCKTHFFYFLLLCSLCSIHSNLFSQNSSISFVFGIDKTHRIHNSFDRHDELNTLINNKLASVKNRLSRFRTNYRIGLDFEQDISKKLFIKFGARLTTLGFNTGYENLRNEDKSFSITDSQGDTYDLNVYYQDFQTRRTLLYKEFLNIELPLTLNVQFSKKAVSHYFEFGAASNLPIAIIKKDVSGRTEYQKKKRLKNQEIKTSFILSYGLNYRITDKGDLFIKLMARYFINNVPLNSQRLNYYNFGIEYGYKINL